MIRMKTGRVRGCNRWGEGGAGGHRQTDGSVCLQFVQFPSATQKVSDSVGEKTCMSIKRSAQLVSLITVPISYSYDMCEVV